MFRLFMISSSLSAIQSSIENEVKSLLNNLLNKKSQYKTNYENILSKFENLLSSSQIDEYIKNIKEKVGSNDVLTYLNDYYTNLINNGVSQYKTVTDNIKSIKVLERLGFRYISSITNEDNISFNNYELKNSAYRK